MRDVENPVVPWSGRGDQYTQDEIDYIVEAIQNADPLTQGKYQQEFENTFKSQMGVQHAFAMTNCTAALTLAAVLTQVGKGDEVIIPAHTFAASAIPFAKTGAKIIWADIDPDTWTISPASVKKLITTKTKVIVPVHLYGLMADMQAIMELAKQHNIYVVEDAGQAPGASCNGKKAGSIGDFGCFSFHTHKNITTLGEGGMLTVKDPELARLVPGLRHNGMRPYDIDRTFYWEPAMSNVDFDWDNVWPFKFCMSEPQAAAGTVQLQRLDVINQERKKRAQKIRLALKDYPELVFQSEPDSHGHIYHLLPARYDGIGNGKTRNDFIKRMAFHHKIKVVVQYYPLYRYPMFKKAGFGQANCPETDKLFDNMVSFPFQRWQSDEQIDYQIESILETLEFLRK